MPQGREMIGNLLKSQPLPKQPEAGLLAKVSQKLLNEGKGQISDGSASRRGPADMTSCLKLLAGAGLAAASLFSASYLLFAVHRRGGRR